MSKRGTNPNSLKNLKPIPKGVSGNPAGRPKGTKDTATVIKRWLEALEKKKNPISGEVEDLTQLDIMVLMQLHKARAGDTTAFNALLDRFEGKPVQKVEQTVDLNTIQIGYGEEKPV